MATSSKEVAYATTLFPQFRSIPETIPTTPDKGNLCGSNPWEKKERTPSPPYSAFFDVLVRNFIRMYTKAYELSTMPATMPASRHPYEYAFRFNVFR